MAIALEMAGASCRGFTLIELLTGLAILALLFLLGMPSFITYLRNSEIRSTSESIINGLRAASGEAARRNSRVGFTLTDANGSWQIRAINDPTTDTDCTVFAPDIIQQFAGKEAKSGAQVTVTPGGKSSVCFTGLGRVWHQQQTPPVDHIQQVDITPAGGGEGRALRIIVDDPAPPAGGPRGLRLCDPALGTLTPPDPRAC
jgi:type IV fimbrial biogenesis protein FimT